MFSSDTDVYSRPYIAELQANCYAVASSIYFLPIEVSQAHTAAANIMMLGLFLLDGANFAHSELTTRVCHHLTSDRIKFPRRAHIVSSFVMFK